MLGAAGPHSSLLRGTSWLAAGFQLRTLQGQRRGGATRRTRCLAAVVRGGRASGDRAVQAPTRGASTGRARRGQLHTAARTCRGQAPASPEGSVMPLSGGRARLQLLGLVPSRGWRRLLGVTTPEPGVPQLALSMHPSCCRCAAACARPCWSRLGLPTTTRGGSGARRVQVAAAGWGWGCRQGPDRAGGGAGVLDIGAVVGVVGVSSGPAAPGAWGAPAPPGWWGWSSWSWRLLCPGLGLGPAGAGSGYMSCWCCCCWRWQTAATSPLSDGDSGCAAHAGTG